MRSRQPPGIRLGVAGTVALAVLIAVGLVWHRSYAALQLETTNAGNSWIAGTVSIGDDRPGSALFTLPTVKPDSGATTLSPPAGGAFLAGHPSTGGSTCVRVTHTGSLPADVRLYAAVTTAGLGRFLLFAIDTGTSTATGPDPTCSGYQRTGLLLGSPGAVLDAVPTDYRTGYPWDGVVPGASRWYRLSWLLPADIANTAQGQHVEASFTWEARSV